MNISTLIIDDETLAREELRYLLEQAGGVELLAEGTNGIEAVELIEQHHPELVFLDVQMPGLDGFAVIERLVARHTEAEARGEDPEPLPHFVFATAFDQYAVRAFDVNAVDYLLKPFDPARVQAAVERVRARLGSAGLGSAGLVSVGLNPAGLAGIAPTEAALAEAAAGSQLAALLKLLNRAPQAERQPSKVIVQTQNRMLLVDPAEICFASIDEGVIRIVTRSLEGQSRCRTLEELQEQLDPASFWRAHRGYVVNINHIREVVPWFKSSYQLRMDDKQQTEVPVSRAQTRRLRELFSL